jgi:hypothetical protein
MGVIKGIASALGFERDVILLLLGRKMQDPLSRRLRRLVCLLCNTFSTCLASKHQASFPDADGITVATLPLVHRISARQESMSRVSGCFAVRVKASTDGLQADWFTELLHAEACGG